ncbi:TIGR01459 family HAD-type hydrolase [Candidatus Paracaedibacter symbiosus]|uniref:TIGR01459 family HAD-type hydrolase n=1 Tax=Candidatus Paracaedibacter symbiosus TaxID=244582 RepID=UPI00068C0580|nr:TIGR01459 family HAD-type hydrolase [Candidatus Paracaedibacter symbiosus]
MKISHLAQIASDYDAYIIDLWGVLHNGQQAFPQAVLALAELKTLQKKIFLLSNSPRLVYASQARLAELGVPRNFYDEVYTSGEDCFQALQHSQDPWYQKLGQKFYHIGPDKNHSLSAGLSRTKVSTVEEADFMLVTGTNGWEVDVTNYVSILEKARLRHLPMVCANPDLTVIYGEETVICAGAIAQYYEGIGGDVRYHGKPHPGIYRVVLDKLLPIKRNRILAIGDSLRTDIKGAYQLQIDTLLVLSGIHNKFQNEPYEAIRDYSLEYFQIEPTYIAPKLKF